FQAEDGIRDLIVTGVQTCALPIYGQRTAPIVRGRVTMGAVRCPCGSPLPYDDCCGRLHVGTAAPTAEALMRSRYSAFATGNAERSEERRVGKACRGGGGGRAETDG